MNKTAPEELALVVASAKRLLENNPNETLEILVTRIIPRWERDLGLQQILLSPEIATLLLQAASNRLAKTTREHLERAMHLPVIEWPYHLCIPLAIARKIASLDPSGALSIRTKAAVLVDDVYPYGLAAYLDNFCLTGTHLRGEDFCSVT